MDKIELNEICENDLTLMASEKEGLKILYRFYDETKKNGFFRNISERDYFNVDLLIKEGYIIRDPKSRHSYIWRMGIPNISMLRDIFEIYTNGKESHIFPKNGVCERQRLKDLKLKMISKNKQLESEHIKNAQLDIEFNVKNNGEFGINEIATLTGFSPSYVSRALNPNPQTYSKVNEESRKIIINVANKNGYKFKSENKVVEKVVPTVQVEKVVTTTDQVENVENLNETHNITIHGIIKQIEFLLDEKYVYPALEDFGKTDNTLENWGYIADKYNIEKTFENLSKIEKIKSELQQIKKASI